MNKIYVAAAGAGKTQTIVQKANIDSGRVLITSFTEENCKEIISRFYLLYGQMPEHVTVMPWYTFLLRYFIRPFQNDFIPERIIGVNMVNGQSAKGSSKNQKSYFFHDGRVYSDKVGHLAYKFINEFDNFPVINLGEIFSHIYIDEAQDMGSYDVDVLKILLKSPLDVICVCDPRQATYTTSHGRKNSGKKGSLFLDNFKCKQIEIDSTTLNRNHRCHPHMVILSNLIYPNFEPSCSSRSECDYADTHAGVYFVRPQDIDDYLKEHNPYQLIYNKSSKGYRKDRPFMTIGRSKGKTFDRTLLFLPDTHQNWLLKKSSLLDGAKASLYVALTRAKISAGVVYNYSDEFNHPLINKYK